MQNNIRTSSQTLDRLSTTLMFQAIKLLRTDAGLNFELNLDPNKRFYCLFGENGVGKTNLLENLTRVLLGGHSMFRKPSPAQAHKYTSLYTRMPLMTELQEYQLRVPEEIYIEGVTIKTTNTSSSWVITSLERLFQGAAFARKIETPNGGGVWTIDKPIVFLPTARRGHADAMNGGLPLMQSRELEFLQIFNRTWTAANGGSLSEENLAKWIISRLILNPNFIPGQINVQQVATVCNALMKLDPAFSGLVDTPSSSGPTMFQIAYENGVLLFMGTPLQKLSTGYVAILKIVQEIVAAYSAWAGMIGEKNISTIDGIVLIDEIEAHLHPKWQVGLIRVLREVFPNTTFMACTHSPLIVSQSDEGEAYELVRTGNDVVSRRLGSPRDWYFADVYSEAFHVTIPSPGSVPLDSAPPLTELLVELSRRVKNYVATRDSASRDAAMELYHQIEKRIPDQDPRERSLSALRSLLG